MSTNQEVSDKPLQANGPQKPGNSIQDVPLNAPTGPRSQSSNQNSRGSFQGPNNRSSSGGPYNDRSRSLSRGSPHGGRGGNRGGSRGGGRGGNRGNNRGGGGGWRGNYRSQSSGGSPFPCGQSNSAESRSGSQGPSNDNTNNRRGSSPYNNNWGNRSTSRNNTQNSQTQPVIAPAVEPVAPQILAPVPLHTVPPKVISGIGFPASELPINTPTLAQQTPEIPINGPSTATNNVAPVFLDSAAAESSKSGIKTTQEVNMEIKQRKKNSRKKKRGGGQTEPGADGEDADNERTSGSEERSLSPVALRFGADLVTASLVTPKTTVTIIPVPGKPGGDPTIDDQDDVEESKLDEQGDKETTRPMLEEFRRENSRFKLLPTRRELTAAVEQMEVYTVVVHSRAANEVVNTIKKATDTLKEGVPDCQHLRRLVKPENLPPSLTGLPESLFIDYSTENQSPSVKVNPDGSVEKVSKSRGASRAQRRRRNASYRKGEKPLYVLLCPVVSMTIRELYEVLSAHSLFAGVDLDCEIPFDSQDIPQVIKHTVPQWAPCNLKQSNYWTEKYWPTIYRRTNPYGPHPFLTNKWEDKLHHPFPLEAMDYVEPNNDGSQMTMGEYYMQLARKVAEEGERKGDGLRIGCVVVELKDRDGPRHGRVMAVAHDARIQANNPLAHACYRAISLVGRKRVEVTARHKPKVNIFALNAPNSTMETDFYSRVPGDPDGYLMNDLVVFMTHEPCVMCSMAMVHSRIGCFVYGEPMVSGGLHADLAPAEGHTLPFRGITDEDVKAYRARHGIPEPDIRPKRVIDPAATDETGEGDGKINVKLPKGKGKAAPGQTREQFLKETANKLKKEMAPVDPSLQTDEAVIEACKDKIVSMKEREREISFFKRIRAALINERDLQEKEAATQARIAAGKESHRKEAVMDKATQTSKIFDPIKNGEDYLGASSSVNIGFPDFKGKGKEKVNEPTNSLTKENLKILSSANEPFDHDLEDGGKFSQTRSVFDAHSKGVGEAGAIAVHITSQINEVQDSKIGAETTLIKEERTGGSGDDSRAQSPAGFFGGLGMIDIAGVNEDSAPTTTAAANVAQKKEGKGLGLATDNISTAEAERGRSRTPAPFRPGTGDFVPVNVSYESQPQPSGSSPDNDFTTSGGEETVGTGYDDDDDSDNNIGASFDIMNVEAPDTAENNGVEGEGEKKKKKKKKKKKRSHAKKKALAEASTSASAALAEGFEVVNTDEVKDASSKLETNGNSATHGSSTTNPSRPSSHEIARDQNTGTSLGNSDPLNPNATADNEDEDEDYDNDIQVAKEEDHEPDELVRPTRPFRLLKERPNTSAPKYDHGAGDGYGLFWREKLNWKFLCFRYSPAEEETLWDGHLNWNGETNDGLHA
ncbi:hypothetical protein AA313_de0207524 [Arthrobotrys entomopaga]|nr:hypothetical protein AA313_de0207524 [Arthrobotrys entomopaga]